MARYTRFKDVSITSSLNYGAVGSEAQLLSSAGVLTPASISSTGAIVGKVVPLGSAVVLTPGATPQINAALGCVFTVSPVEAESIDIVGGTTGQSIVLVVSVTQTTARVLTFSTNFKSTGTLTTGTATGKIFTLSFLCYDGTNFAETGRTTAQ